MLSSLLYSRTRVLYRIEVAQLFFKSSPGCIFNISFDVIRYLLINSTEANKVRRHTTSNVTFCINTTISQSCRVYRNGLAGSNPSRVSTTTLLTGKRIS